MASLCGKNVLLCEDHTLNAAITTKILEHEGMNVSIAANGKEGVKIFRDSPIKHFSAVIMDICMPEMDGIEAAHNMRELKREDAADIPIIALTAKCGDRECTASINAVMDAQLIKPIDPKNLYSVLQRLICAS